MQLTLASSKSLDSGITTADLSLEEFNGFNHWDEGAYRKVYVSDKFPDVVVKRIHWHTADLTNEEDAKNWNYEMKHQIRELHTWRQLCDSGLGELVPRHDVLVTDNGEVVTIVERIDFASESEYMEYEDYLELAPHLTEFFQKEYVQDLQLGSNFGLTDDNRFILRDAGT